jgi:hypothetical protein
MTKPISTRLHGVIDYSWAAAASRLANRVDGATSTARLLRNAATAATASSFITNYECGAIRVMPMKGHLALDAVMCTALLASPLFLPASERRYAVVPMILGAIGLVTGLLTETRSPMEAHEEFGGMHGGGERWTIADET